MVETQDAVFNLELTHEDVRGAQWIKNGIEILPSEKFEITIEGTVHTLKIKNCTTQDESVYSFKLGKLSANARLNVESKQLLISFQELIPKNPKVFRCTVPMETVPSVSVKYFSHSHQDPEEAKGRDITFGCSCRIRAGHLRGQHPCEMDVQKCGAEAKRALQDAV